MPSSIRVANGVMLGLALTGWVLLSVAFLRGRRIAGSRHKARRDPLSWLGVALGVAGFTLVWTARRPFDEPPIGRTAPLLLAAVLVTALLVAVAVWLVWGAFRALGAQWSVQAQVGSGHQLVTTGPYARVRHPIYTGLGALLLATGLALSRPMAVLGGILAYGIGTALRIRCEEALLRQAFGEAYVEYASRVPAVLPRPRVRVDHALRARR